MPRATPGPMRATVIEIDGAHGEGGGQLVRTAVALSALTGRPLALRNVRAGRPRPGLAPQHLAAVRAVAALCEARCEGLEPRSAAFTFEPRAHPAGGELRVDVGTAGSVTLVPQARLLVLLGRMRLRVRARLARRGYSPRGGGEVALEVEPGVPAPLDMREPSAS